MKFNLALFISLLLIVASSCTISKPNRLYAKIEIGASRDSINKVRKTIMDLPNDRFATHQFTSKNSTSINYRLLQPVANVAKKSYPLVVVLHGSHAVGTDNVTQMGILAKLWAMPTIYRSYPAYVIAPQFPSRSSNYVMDDQKKVLISEPQACLNDVFELIDSLLKTYPIDPKRIYIIGHSMGASGVTNAIGLKPNLFAAGVAASGIPNFNNLAALASTPLWLAHGNADPENPIATDLLLYQELQKLHAKKIIFNEIVGMEHELWPDLFLSELLPKWLLSQRRK